MRKWTVIAFALVLTGGGGTTLAFQAAEKARQPSGESDAQKSGATSEQKPDERPKREVRRLELFGREPQIGVSIEDVEADRAGGVTGAVVEHVREDGPGAKAGLQEGDVIVEFDGEKVRSARHLARLVGETAAGRTVSATLLRNGARVTVQLAPERREAAMFQGDFAFPAMRVERLPELRLEGREFRFDDGELDALLDEHGIRRHGDGAFGVRIAPPARGRLGVTIQDLTPQLAEYFGSRDGVLVSSVRQDSPAAKAGVRAGDVITAVNDTPVSSPADLTRAVRRARPGTVSLTYVRDRKSATATVTLEEEPEPEKVREEI